MFNVIYGQKNWQEARKGMDGAMGGSEEEENREGDLLLPYFPYTEPLLEFVSL